MVRKNWGRAKSRHQSIRTLREAGSANPRLPDFLSDSEDPVSEPLVEDDGHREEREDYGADEGAHSGENSPLDQSFLFKKLPYGGLLFIMNKISFLSITFGLLFMGILLYTAGILTAYYILPGGPKAMGVAFQGGQGTGGLPKIELPTKADITRSIEKAVGKLGEAPKKQDVEKVINSAMKAITPEFAQPTVQKFVGPKAVDQEFIDGARRTPTDSDAGRFTVQAKVYGDGAWAMQLARRLKEEGYGAYIVRVKEQHRNQQFYHARVGVFGDYMAANTMVRTLREMGNRSATVVLVARGEDRIVP